VLTEGNLLLIRC